MTKSRTSKCLLSQRADQPFPAVPNSVSAVLREARDVSFKGHVYRLRHPCHARSRWSRFYGVTHAWCEKHHRQTLFASIHRSRSPRSTCTRRPVRTTTSSRLWIMC